MGKLRENMKKILLSFVVFVVGAAYADNTITSKEYVDGQVAELQIQIPAKNVNTVVMNTDTAGEIGEKAIYNSNNDYAEQQDALVDAQTFNAAVQNALESEFVCIEWQGSVHDNAHCLLYEVKNAYHKSKNLFDVSRIPERIGRADPYSTLLVNNGDGSITVTRAVNNSAALTGKTLQQLAPDVVVGNTYILGFKTTGTVDYVLLYNAQSGNTTWQKNNPLVIQQKHLDSIVYFYPGGKCTDDGQCPSATISNIQIEQGSVATPYVPYGNVYMPQGEQ